MKLLGEFNEDVASNYSNLGHSYANDGQFDNGTHYFKKAFDIRSHLYGSNSELTDESRFILALAYYDNNRNRRASSLLKGSRKFREKHFGKNSEEYNNVIEWLKKIIDFKLYDQTIK